MSSKLALYIASLRNITVIAMKKKKNNIRNRHPGNTEETHWGQSGIFLNTFLCSDELGYFFAGFYTSFESLEYSPHSGLHLLFVPRAEMLTHFYYSKPWDQACRCVLHLSFATFFSNPLERFHLKANPTSSTKTIIQQQVWFSWLFL